MRARKALITLGLFALAVIVGGVLVSIGVLIAMSSKRGGNQGIYDRDDDGTEI